MRERVLFIYHFKFSDKEDTCDFLFDIEAESTEQAITKASIAMRDSANDEGFIHVPLIGDGVKGTISINPASIGMNNIVTFDVLNEETGSKE